MIDVSKLLFIQYHLPEIDLNDPEVMEFLLEVATKANEDREKNLDFINWIGTVKKVQDLFIG